MKYMFSEQEQVNALYQEELADIVLRVCCDAKDFGVDLEWAMRIKNAYNKTRSHRHGETREEFERRDAFNQVINEFRDGLRAAGLVIGEDDGGPCSRRLWIEGQSVALSFRYRVGYGMSAIGSLTPTKYPLDAMTKEPEGLKSRLFNYVQTYALALHGLATK